MLLKRFSLGKDLSLLKLNKGDEIRISGKEQRHLRASRYEGNHFKPVFSVCERSFPFHFLTFTIYIYSVALKENVELFDTLGARVIALVKSTDSNVSVLTLLKHVKPSEFTTSITLAVGMPKGSRSDWLVEKATETGISSLIPLEADRNVLRVKDLKCDHNPVFSPRFFFSFLSFLFASQISLQVFFFVIF
jgi:hypothetical protein